MKIAYRGYTALAVVVLEISLWSVILQIGGSRIGLLPELFYGFLVGSLVSVSISLAKDRGRGLASIAKRPNMLAIMVVAGLLNDVLTQLFFGIGTLGTNPSIGAIVFRSWVIMVAILTPIALRQKVSAKQLMATIIGFAGIYLILSGGTLFHFDTGQAGYVGMLLMAAACSTFSTLIMNKYNVDTAGAIAIFNVASFAVICAVILSTHTSIVIAFTTKVILSILFLGVIAYGIGTMLYYYSVKILGPLITGNSILVVPFLTIVFSFFMVGTPIKPYYVIAAMFAAIGIVLQRRYSKTHEYISSRDIRHSRTLFDVTGAFVTNKGEVGRMISDGNRAFAAKLDGGLFVKGIHSQIFEKRHCVAFTNKRPYRDVRPDEIDFANELSGSDGEEVLIGVGHPKNLEDSFRELELAVKDGRAKKR